MNSWHRPSGWVVAGAIALLLSVLPLHLATAEGPVKVRVETTDLGFKPEAIEVEQGQVVELTFVWAHVGYVEEKHVMVLDLVGQKLEWEEINFDNREATQQFIADKPGTFNFKCDLDCDIHDYLQKGALKVSRSSGGASVAFTPTVLSLSSSSLVTAGDPVLLTVALKDSQGKPVPKAEVRFRQDTSFAGAKAPMELGIVKTDANGVAFLNFQPTLADRQQTITAAFAGMGLYAESEQAMQITEVGVPPPAYKTALIGLEPLRRWAPFALAGIILGVWAAFAFVLYQAFGVAWTRARR